MCVNNIIAPATMVSDDGCKQHCNDDDGDGNDFRVNDAGNELMVSDDGNELMMSETVCMQ